VKAAAGWIRKQPEFDGNVFSDASGGTGLEPPLMRLYFRTGFYAEYDASSPSHPYKKFVKKKENISYLVVKPGNRKLVSKFFGDEFKEAARVVDGSGELLVIFGREERAVVQTIPVDDGDREFDRSFGLLCRS
jgi:hypothetical protein